VLEKQRFVWVERVEQEGWAAWDPFAGVIDWNRISLMASTRLRKSGVLETCFCRPLCRLC